MGYFLNANSLYYIELQKFTIQNLRYSFKKNFGFDILGAYMPLQNC
jgi:hypothetical protein